jgi:protein-S-isoprenylcysteine O-methyltransferase Ste14
VSRIRELLRQHGHILVNLFLFACLGKFFIDKILDTWFAEKLDFVEVAFALHNMILLPILLIRRQHRAIDRSGWHQAVALVAFFSGIFFVSAGPGGHPWLPGWLLPSAPGTAMLWTSRGIVAAVTLIGTLSLLSLGRSFGILIAVREVKTRGAYGVIRHPMYLSDILWRVGYTLANLCALNAALLAVSSACYVYRALLEERFLAQTGEYRQYMERVRYRFIPGIF